MMSFDLYLIPLRIEDDFEAAMAVLDSFDYLPDTSAPIPPRDVRDAAEILMKLDPRYRPFEKDYLEIARFEGISELEARCRYDYVELDGPDDQRMAQFIFCRNHIVIHWYSGTSEEEMDRYLKAICKATGLSLVDPQDGKVWRLHADGEFH